ncbi:hypothetical protein Q8F55_007239 [Vanrija albida]|uniref:Xylanolytic transcriptional activator regulatory domain-containing protein n=1 Tax=Vanrija albida TaxID=181172 RepID=A0ABR3PZD1_9TREE
MPAVTTTSLTAPPKKRNFACESCRSKKLCTTLKTECIYKGIPSSKYLHDLEDHATKLRDTLSRLKHASKEERDQILDLIDDSNIPATGPNPDGFGAERMSKITNGPVKLDSLVDTFKEQVKISTDTDNRAALHGPSSLYYLSSANTAQSPPPAQADLVTDALDIEHHLMMDWIDRVALAASFPVMNEEVWRYVLKMHFTWVQPMFGFVHHKTFMRDMHRPRTPQSMFSPFLLYCLCTHVIRACDVNLLSDGQNPSDPFLPQAKLLVLREVERGSSLSAIAGLLTLSAKIMSLGHVSPAWVYLGMAIRMIDDLGIHLDGKTPASESQFSTEELESRRHMFWSAYLWDKTMSTYLGRMPMLQQTRDSPKPIDPDVELDAAPWTPVGNRLDQFPPFKSCPSLELSTFCNSSRLAIIMNDILLYDNGFSCPLSAEGRGGEAGAPLLDSIHRALKEWRTKLPPELQFSPKDEPERVPPAHIINLNCLYHMLSILLDRRQAVGVVQDSSVKSALEISILAQLSHSHFLDREAVLSHCYCIYTASLVFLSKLRLRTNEGWLSDEEAVLVTSLQWCLNRLSNASTTIAALRGPVTVLHEKVSTLPGPIASIIISAIGPPPVNPDVPSAEFPAATATNGTAAHTSPDSINSAQSLQSLVSSAPNRKSTAPPLQPTTFENNNLTLESALAAILRNDTSTLASAAAVAANETSPQSNQSNPVAAAPTLVDNGAIGPGSDFWGWLGGGEFSAQAAQSGPQIQPTGADVDMSWLYSVPDS